MRTTSRVCEIGTEIDARRLRRKARERKTIPGMKKLRDIIIFAEETIGC